MTSILTNTGPSRTSVNNVPPVTVYAGWHLVPVHLKTASAWKWQYNRVPVGRESAVVEWDRNSLWPRRAKLYSFPQTRTYRPSRRTLAARWFCDIFQASSSRDRYLWSAEGRWVSCPGKLSAQEVRRHVQQDGIYGIVGGRWTRFLAIDLDLHGGDYIVFLRQLEALLGKLWGMSRWFLQVADREAEGVHLILPLIRPNRTSVARSWLRKLLVELNSQNASLAREAREAGMKTLADLEIFPDTKRGFRLPCSRGRSLLVDRRLELVQYRGRDVADVVSLWKWCQDDGRRHMLIPEVLGYVAGSLAIHEPPSVRRSSSALEVISQSEVSESPSQRMKGNYRQFVVNFWSGKSNEPDSLNKAIHLLTLMAPYYFPADPSGAIKAVEKLIDNLPDWSFSSRLSTGRREEVSRVVRYDVVSAYSNSSAESRRKLKRTYEAWSAIGFNPFDPTTWRKSGEKLKDWDWTIEEVTAIQRLASVLKCNFEQADELIRRLLGFVATSRREMSVNYVKTVMEDLGIKVGSKRDNKPKQLIDKMQIMGWVFVKSDAGPGRARKFGIGNVLAGRLSVRKQAAQLM